jgi:hypothetical protein
MNPDDGSLNQTIHARILLEEVIPDSGLNKASSHAKPRAIILAGQPGAGKGGLVRTAESELSFDVVKIDPDELRKYHPDVESFREAHPYTWSGLTHPDASQWATELRDAAVASRKNLIIDTTLGNGDSAVRLIDTLQKQGYEVEVRAIATHKLESELGVDKRFTDLLDTQGHGRYVPQEVRGHVYDALPESLDKIRAGTDAPISIFNREGQQLYNSRMDTRSPGDVLSQAREARVADPKLSRSLNDGWKAQEAWHQGLHESLAHNPKVAPPTAQNLLNERAALNIVDGVTRSSNETAVLYQAAQQRSVGMAAKGLGVLGAGAMAYDAYTTAEQYRALSAKSNQFGADALLHRYEGRTAGGVLGGIGLGLAVGAETGPGALITGAVGGVLGAWGGDKIATAYNEHQLNHQIGTDGVTYAYDKGQWTHTSRSVGLGSYDLPTIMETTVHAPPAQLSTLDYQRTTAVTALALANPATQDTKHITLGNTEWRATHDGWAKQVDMPGVQTNSFGIPSSATVNEPADAKTSVQLNQIAANRQFNNDHYAESVSKAYVMDYYGKGWSANGPLPETVTKTLKLPSCQDPPGCFVSY